MKAQRGSGRGINGGQCRKCMDLAIFGAQGMALGAWEAIHNLYPIRNIRCFLVTERGNNGKHLSGIPVLELDSFAKALSAEEKANIEVLIATPENMMPGIETSLEEHGLPCHVRLTSPRWSELMKCYYVCDKEYMPLRALPVGYHRADMHVFMAKFHLDKPLAGRYDLPEWITPIQVGASQSSRRVANILDCDGENISAKNGNYSELTALYWIWKNRLLYPSDSLETEYYGLAHYRRILELTEDDVLRLADNEVDVVLPYPLLYEPNIEEHPKRYLKTEDWEAVQRAVREAEPEYAGEFPRILKQKYFYNYNIILARKEVLAEYCGWLFPILERVEELSIPESGKRSDRYIGYVGETLATLYFLSQKKRLNIMNAGCRFLT